MFEIGGTISPRLLAELWRVFADARVRYLTTLRKRGISALGTTRARLPTDDALATLIHSFSRSVDGRHHYRNEALAAAALLLADYLQDPDVLTILKGE